MSKLMGNQSAHRSRKRRTDKLDWEELEKAPNVDGMMSYLRQPPVNGVPQGSDPLAVVDPTSYHETSVNAGNAATPELTISNGETTISTLDPTIPTKTLSPIPKIPTPTLQHETAIEATPSARLIIPDAEPLLPHALNVARPEPSLTGGRPDTSRVAFPLSNQRNRRAHRCVLVQDAHTPGEQVLLSTLYRLAKHPRWGRAELNGSYLVNVPLLQLASQTAMHETNVRFNLRNLIEKLAIEVVERENKLKQTARTYRVFNFKQILERRRAAGLEYVTKNRGIRFITKEEAEQLLGTDPLGSDFDEQDLPLGSDSPPDATSESLPSLPSDSPPLLIIGNKSFKNQQETTTTAPTQAPPRPQQFPNIVEVQKSQPTVLPHEFDAISETLTQYCYADTKLVVSLINSCRQRVSDATLSEIIGFIHQKGGLINSKTTNPPGFLLDAVPKCFEGLAFQNFRGRRLEAQRKQFEEEKKEQIKLRVGRVLELVPTSNPWTTIVERLKTTLTPHSISTWIKPLRYLKTLEHEFLVWVPSVEFIFVKEKFASEIRSACRELGLPVEEVRLVTSEEFSAEFLERNS